MNEIDSLEADNIEVKEELHRHESSNDWDDLGIDFENASQTVSTNESSNTPKPRSNLDEVIELVILDALEYADASPDKRVLPRLVRKSTKSRSKQVVTSNSNTNITNFSTVSNHQMTTNNHTTNALMSQTAASSNTTNNSNNNSSLHPLMQTNFVHPNMQQMATQLQLAASGKASNTSTSLMQHNMLGSTGVTNNQTQQQQQLTAAMMGFGSPQIPNMMMPNYNGNVPITYHQQMASGQYHLPVTFAQIQQLQQQYQQQQQHQPAQQSHLVLNSNPNSSDMTAVNNSQQNNMNFVTGSNTNTQQQQQQAMVPTSYTNFSNQSIPVTPYQIPGMMHTFATPAGPASNTGTQLMAANSPSAATNGIVASATNSRYLSPNSNATSTNNGSNCTNTSITLSHNGPNTALSSSASSVAAPSMASLYQQLPPNAINASPFDFHQQQLLYNQRLLQAQQASNDNVAGILSDYTVPRYGGY